MKSKSRYRLPTWCIILLLAGSAHSGTDGLQSSIAAPAQTRFVRDMSAAMDRMMRDMHTHGATGNADADFLAMMIPHHEGAVEMARLELLRGKDPLVRHLAEEIIATQNVEIQAMRKRYAVISRGRDRDPDGTLVLGSVRGPALQRPSLPELHEGIRSARMRSRAQATP